MWFDISMADPHRMNVDQGSQHLIQINLKS